MLFRPVELMSTHWVSIKLKYTAESITRLKVRVLNPAMVIVEDCVR